MTVIALNTSIRKKRNARIKNLSSHVTEQLKEKQNKPKESKRKEIIKMRVTINEIENRPTTEKNNETKNWFLVKDLYD